MATLRPRGPSVTATARPSVSTPCSMLSRASKANLMSLGRHGILPQRFIASFRPASGYFIW